MIEADNFDALRWLRIGYSGRVNCIYIEPIDPSPTIDQAVNGGFPWLEIRCSRCKTPSDVDLAAMKRPPTTFVHDLASRLRCQKCAKAGRRPSAALLQLAWQPRHPKAGV